MKKKKKQLPKNDLLDLKNKIEKAKNDLAELKGRQKGLLNDLKEKWDCSSVQEAMSKLNNLEKKAEKYRSSIQKGKEKLINDYPDLL